MAWNPEDREADVLIPNPPTHYRTSLSRTRPHGHQRFVVLPFARVSNPAEGRIRWRCSLARVSILAGATQFKSSRDYR